MSATIRHRRSSSVGLAAFLAPSLMSASVLLATTGCSVPQPKPQNENIRHPYYELEDAQPAEVAVVPIRDQSKEGSFPVDTLRRALYDGLATRLYTPIDLDFVDANWTEAGFDPTALQAGGVIQVVVKKWDRSLLVSHGAILTEFTVEMLDGQRPGARPLWGHTFVRRLELASERTQMTEQELFDHSAELLARQILAELPPRDPARE